MDPQNGSRREFHRILSFFYQYVRHAAYLRQSGFSPEIQEQENRRRREAGKWDGPRSLHEMFGEESRELLPFVDDYHLHLLVPDEITDFGKFTTSLGRVLEIIKASEDKDKMEEVIMANPEYKALENEALSMINVFTELVIKADEKGEKTDMCKAWLDQRLDGVREGREAGIKEGIRVLILDNIEEGKSRDAVIGKLIRRFSLQESEAVEYYDAFAPVANAES